MFSASAGLHQGQFGIGVYSVQDAPQPLFGVFPCHHIVDDRFRSTAPSPVNRKQHEFSPCCEKGGDVDVTGENLPAGVGGKGTHGDDDRHRRDSRPQSRFQILLLSSEEFLPVSPLLIQRNVARRLVRSHFLSASVRVERRICGAFLTLASEQLFNFPQQR